MMHYTTDINWAEFDENGLSTVAGWAVIYRAHPVTGEYLGADMSQIPYACSVAQYAYLDKPVLPATTGRAIVRSMDETVWQHVIDYRGKKVYDTATRQEMAIDYLGELRPEHTEQAPDTPFDNWDGQQWVTDTVAQHQHALQQAESHRQVLLHEAEEQIRQLERRKRLGMATEREVTLLQAWEIYSVRLSDVDCSIAPDIHWPEQPK
ncbi:tail fiber assembly protein [Xenorhabdus sp. KK7.4]|uniref:tail fiber assembly protein n=1 Tax=Xenorhabdus sp. KK7.4 TaxID=1851572 RepID=UPI000C065694|nr:tail fiber assembly protein [Xenorhabdus sp. KK7.4]PHM51745.1 tail fiber protein of a prophage [Xenorhabdus sp. KK7.4]